MALIELTEEEFSSFRDRSDYRSFMQTLEVGALRKKSGWNVYYVGLKEQKKLIAATMLLSKKRYFGKYEFYAPRGPLLDFNDLALVRKFMEELKLFVKQHHGYCLRLDPYVVYKERDGAGKIIENGINHSSLVDLLNRQGFRKVDKKDQEQVDFMYILNIDGKSEEDILKNMKSNARNIIRKTLKYGIEIEELSFDELDRFYKIMIETGKRKGFAIRDFSYYQNMYTLFQPKGEIKFLITKLNLNHHIDLLEQEKNDQLKTKEKLSSSKCNDGKKKAIDEAISGIDAKINTAKKIKQEAGEEIVLSGSMFVMNDPEVVYLSSGNYEEFLMYNSQYLIQWEMIKYAIAHHFKRYNFYGIPDSFDKNDKDYGIYEFKTHFNGYVEQLIGEFVLPVSPVYHLIHLLHRIKRK